MMKSVNSSRRSPKSLTVIPAIQVEEDQEIIPESYSLIASKHLHVSIGAGPQLLDFNKRRYMPALLDEDSLDTVVMGGRQFGKSTSAAINKIIKNISSQLASETSARPGKGPNSRSIASLISASMLIHSSTHCPSMPRMCWR